MGSFPRGKGIPRFLFSYFNNVFKDFNDFKRYTDEMKDKLNTYYQDIRNEESRIKNEELNKKIEFKM